MEFIVAQVLVQTAVIILQIIALLIAPFVFFDVPNEGSMILLSIELFFQSFNGTICGILIGIVSKDSIQGIILCMAIYIVILPCSGTICPLEYSPFWLQKISSLLPLTQPVDALRSIMSKGWGINYYQVYIAFLSSSIWFMIFLSLCFIFVKIKF